MELEECMKDAIDDSMKAYINSEAYQEQKKEINQMLSDIRLMLSKEQNEMLNKLINAIGRCDSGFASEAYVKGVVDGMVLRERKMAGI